MLTFVLFIAAAPSIVVVHDGRADVAELVAGELLASGRATATLLPGPLAGSCARDAACKQRPTADALVLVTTSPSSAAGTVELVLLGPRGEVLAQEVLAAADPSLLRALMAEPLSRLLAAAEAASASGASVGVAAATEDDGAGPWPWVLGGVAVCAGVCGVGLVVALSYALVTSAASAGEAAGDSCGSALGNACTAPFDALGDGIGACGSAGDACTGAVGSCSLAASPAAPAGPVPQPPSRAAPASWPRRNEGTGMAF
ncbi:MAG: hypothetical protein HYS27_07245 [Deltaproteobacteria bacterium]|nr:hypothetical protein [Deltaproteobacteria bacterium]